MRLDRLGIKWKLFFYIALFAGMMIAVLWIFQTVFLDSFYKYIKTEQIVSAAETIGQNIENSELQELVSRIAQGDGICVTVSDGSGNLLCSADVLPDCLIHHMPLPMLAEFRDKALANGGTYVEKFTRENLKNAEYDRERFRGPAPPPDRGMSESLVCVKSVMGGDGAEYTVLLNSTISPVGATVDTLRVQLIWVTAVLLLLAFALALFISRKISRPLINLNESAKRLARGEYGVIFEGRGYREIVQLSDTLNTAAFELSRVEELRRELISNVSHDLRTPLTMIIGFAEVMRDLPGENTPENAQVIIDEAARLTRLVADLLDLSKLQSNAGELNMSTFNLTQSIRGTAARLSALLEREPVTITFDADEDAYVTADELQISQVIYNLLANAVTHTGSDAAIGVIQTVSDGSVRVEVRDNGPGIPKEQLPYIWERYYKVDKTHTRAQVGSGLGLSIVKGVLERHGAGYGAESESGKGCIFWFSLPLSKEQQKSGACAEEHR